MVERAREARRAGAEPRRDDLAVRRHRVRRDAAREAPRRRQSEQRQALARRRHRDRPGGYSFGHAAVPRVEHAR